MADRRILVQIVGDSSSVERAFQRSGQAATGFNDQIAGTRKSMDDLVRVSAARGKSLGLFRLAGIGVGAGIAISTTTRAIASLREGLEVSGEEAETFTGRMRNMGAAILSGDVVGAFTAMTRETHNFTAAQVEAIAVSPQLIEMIKRMGDTAALSTAALASMAALLETPGRLQLGEARAARTSSSRDNLANLDAQIADREETIRKLKEQGALVTGEGEADKILAAAIRQVTALENQKEALLRALGAAKQKTAAAARAAFEAPFLAGLKGLGLKADKALLTATLDDDIAASNQIIRRILIQIEQEGHTFELEKLLNDIRLKRQGQVKEQRANRKAAAATRAATAAAAQAEAEAAAQEAWQNTLGFLQLDLDKAGENFKKQLQAAAAIERAILAQIAKEGKTLDLMRELFAIRGQQADIVEAQREKKAADVLASQYKLLGLTATGEKPAPSLQALRKRFGTLKEAVEGTLLDTPKTARTFAGIAKVLAQGPKNVKREMRLAILDMYKGIADALGQGDKIVSVTTTQRRGVGKILEGLGLTPEQVRALRQRLAKGGTIGGFGGPAGGRGGGVPAGAGRGDVVVHGNLVVSGVRDVDQFVKEVQRRGKRSSASRRGTTPGQNRALA